MTTPHDGVPASGHEPGRPEVRPGMHAGPVQGPAAEPSAEELERVATPATVRRAPRYRAFAVAGALVGVLAAVVAVVLVPEPVGADAPLSTSSVLLVLAVIAAGLGALLGTAVAVVVERWGARRASAR